MIKPLSFTDNLILAIWQNLTSDYTGSPTTKNGFPRKTFIMLKNIQVSWQMRKAAAKELIQNMQVWMIKLMVFTFFWHISSLELAGQHLTLLTKYVMDI